TQMYSNLQSRLRAYRSTLPEISAARDTCTIKDFSIYKPRTSFCTLNGRTSYSEPGKCLPQFFRTLSSWWFQLFVTLLLWIVAIRLEFGAVWFVFACLYWLCVKGTDKHRRPRNPDEQVISAGFFFDSSPTPLAGMSTN
ncbi:unnamed protein product, partial [Dicrocoelium dendriticum]